MSYPDQKREPRLDKESQKFAIDLLFGETNTDLKEGNIKVEMARIISGGSYRYLQSLLSLSERFKKEFNPSQVLRNEILGTIGLTPELAEHGARGELTEIVTQADSPKKELVTRTDSKLIRQPTPEGQSQQ